MYSRDVIDKHSLTVSVLFSEPKIPQSLLLKKIFDSITEGFSALQRAENSSIVWQRAARWAVTKFQCSSASRKFLNSCTVAPGGRYLHRFSALQRAENSSIDLRPTKDTSVLIVSVLFSEPKIPQFTLYIRECFTLYVSVLFSEPKIPQSN